MQQESQNQRIKTGGERSGSQIQTATPRRGSNHQEQLFLWRTGGLARDECGYNGTQSWGVITINQHINSITGYVLQRRAHRGQ